jgi:hypothetical protein
VLNWRTRNDEATAVQNICTGGAVTSMSQTNVRSYVIDIKSVWAKDQCHSPSSLLLHQPDLAFRFSLSPLDEISTITGISNYSTLPPIYPRSHAHQCEIGTPLRWYPHWCLTQLPHNIIDITLLNSPESSRKSGTPQITRSGILQSSQKITTINSHL